MSDIQEPQLESTSPQPVIEVPAVVETEKGPSLDDTLAKTMAEIVAKRPVQGEDGKFIQKAGAETATPEVKLPGQSQTGAPEPVKPAIEAPQSLPANVKALWGSLAPEVQEYWAGRESEVHKKITSDGERLKSLSAFEEVTGQLQDRLKQVGAPAPEYFRRLAAADQLLSTDGIGGIRQIAQMYGIDLRPLYQPGAPPQGQAMDPTINALLQKTSALESKIDSQEKAVQAAREAEADRKVEAFKKDRPHFDKVEPLMIALYKANPDKELADLYDMAVNADPDTRKEIEAERAKKAEADALEEKKRQAAEAAKLAPFSRKPGSVGNAAKAGASMEDTMAATFRQIKARG